MENKMNNRENYLRAMEFRKPEWIPCDAYLSPATWMAHGEKLHELVLRHPEIFKDDGGRVDFHELPPAYKKGEYYTDNWGCVWFNAYDGLEGQVVENPLTDWDAFNSYIPPDPATKTERGDRDWEQVARETAERKSNGLLTRGSGERLFDRLYLLRGFENLMIDIAADSPQLPRLIDMLLDFELNLVKRWLDIGVDVIYFHTDIGTQNAMMISPAKFRKYIKPMFKQIFSLCRDGGAHVALSSDGRLLEIVDDLVECGVAMHDPQLRANTLEGIARAYKGKMCISLDLDRQMFPFCTPADIFRQVEEAVEKLNSPEGGLMVQAWVFGDDVPLENIEAICSALEKYCLKI